MNNTPFPEIAATVAAQKRFFAEGATRSLRFRRQQLQRLSEGIRRYEADIQAALWADLRKSNQEAYLSEISIVQQEIALHLKHLTRWARTRQVATPWHLWPSSSYLLTEPLGVGLIIAPWNYPFQLLINPLVGAISAGCCAYLKPSPYTENTALVMQRLIGELFPPHYIAMAQGGREVNEYLLSLRFDTIFFTGSPAVGKVVMHAAAQHLCPVVLELGGKSPCIVDRDANLDLAARRIAWGKTLNAGQTCIAPDYLMVHNEVRDELLAKIAQQFKALHGDNIQQSTTYPRIVNRAAFERLTQLLASGVVEAGGATDATDLYIEPTLLRVLPDSSAAMREEIFGPILPVFCFNHLQSALDYVNGQEKPLAFYYFGSNKQARRALEATSSGGVCLNDTILHIANHHLPFGGVGASGLGKYHGLPSFLAFSHQRAVLRCSTWIDLPFRYPPFRFFSWVKRVV